MICVDAGSVVSGFRSLPALLIVEAGRSRIDPELVVVEAAIMALIGALVLVRLAVSIHERRKIEQALALEARHDSLTGLLNHKAFVDRLEALVARREHVAVLFMDLDDFKPINDTYGHATGDQVLALSAARLAACAHGSGVAARIGGDEFALLLPGADRAGTDRVSAHRGKLCRATRTGHREPARQSHNRHSARPGIWYHQRAALARGRLCHVRRESRRQDAGRRAQGSHQ